MIKALVTGGHNGIGAAIRRALLAQNFDVVYSYDNSEVESHDVTNYNVIQHYMLSIGKIDLLVNCAGVCIYSPFQDTAPGAFKKQVDVNLIGLMNVCHAAIPYLKGGDIVNIASRAGAYGHAGLAAYCASKAGVMAFSEALALDLRPLGIRVGYIMPGTVATALGGIHEIADWQIQPEDVGRAVVNMWNMPRRASLGRVELKPSFPIGG